MRIVISVVVDLHAFGNPLQQKVTHLPKKMATCTNSKLHQEKVEEDDKLCTICLELKKDPRLLPCLHSYCKGCLENVHSKSKCPNLSCPQCRADHGIPSEGIAGFPQDQVLANAIQAHITKMQIVGGKPTKKVDISRQCTMCTEDDPATSFCSTCGKFLCEFCQKAHKRLVDFRHHKFTSLSELDQVDKLIATAELPSYCTLHSGEVLKLYCITCQKVICRDCTIVNHRNHEYGFINELRPLVQQGVKTTVARLQAKQREFEAHLTFLKDLESSRNAHSAMLENEITSAFNTYIEDLKTRQAELLSIEQASKEGDLKQIWAQKQHIETTLANLSSAVRYAERLCACPSNMMMLTVQGEAIPRLNSLQCTTWNASDIEISLPNTFSKTELRLSEAGVLKPDSVSVSMRMESSVPSPAPQGYPGAVVAQTQRGTHYSHHNLGFLDDLVPASELGRKQASYYTDRSNVRLGEMVHYIIEVNSSKTNCHIAPSISIRTAMQDHRILYTTRYHGDGVWSLTFKPPCIDQFTTTVSVNNGEVPAQKLVIGNVYSKLTKQERRRHQIPQKVVATAAHTIRVTGALKVGDVVCRGPHWEGGDDDGGVGGLGTITEMILNQTSEPPNAKRRHQAPENVQAFRYTENSQTIGLTVKWENGRVGEYKAQGGCFEVELAPPELSRL